MDKNLITFIGEAIDQYRNQRRRNAESMVDTPDNDHQTSVNGRKRILKR